MKLQEALLLDAEAFFTDSPLGVWYDALPIVIALSDWGGEEWLSAPMDWVQESWFSLLVREAIKE